MDPNACLDEMLKLSESLLDDIEELHQVEGELPSEQAADADNVTRLCELVQALDGWLAGKGFLPQRWAR